MMTAPLLIRADASSQIGTGHIMRCLALAQAWQDRGGTVTFAAYHNLPPPLQIRLQTEGMGVFLLDTEPGSADDADQATALAHQLGAEWLVVDGYQFGADYQRQIKTAGLKLLFLDDYGHAREYCADLVLNQNISASESLYTARSNDTKLLLGTRFALLRREFWDRSRWHSTEPNTESLVLVTMGGADPGNITSWVLKILAGLNLDSSPVVAVVGGSNQHGDDLRSIAHQYEGRVRLEYNVRDMSSLIRRAEIAVSSGGSTLWELAAVGVPTIIITIADNQIELARAMARSGTAIYLGQAVDLQYDQLIDAVIHLLRNPEQRGLMREAGQAAVDGHGVQRVISFMCGE